MTKQDFHVGQTVYLYHERNYCKGSTIEERIIETKVISVGRRYLAVNYWGQTEFDMTNNFRQKTIYSPEFVLYLSKEEIYLMIETENQRHIVRDELDRYLNTLPMEGLQEIMAILNKYAEVKANE